MSGSERRMAQYLLGELSESDRESFEREYFADPAVFDRLVVAEAALVDDYLRDRLPPDIRRKFEQIYAVHPSRRDRVRFAQALAAHVDARSAASGVPQMPRSGGSLRGQLRAVWRLQTPVARIVLAASLALCVIGALALLIGTTRLRRDLTSARGAAAGAEQRSRDLQRQISVEQTRVGQLNDELRRLREQLPAAQNVVSLLLNLRATRSAGSGAVPLLTIAPGVQQVRLEAEIGTASYSRYRLAVNAIDGPLVIVRDHVLPRTDSLSPRLLMEIPSDRLAAGDYILTVSGETQGGDTDDIGKTVFRVQKK